MRVHPSELRINTLHDAARVARNADGGDPVKRRRGVARHIDCVECGADVLGPTAEMSPETAQEYGLEEGDFIAVESRYGAIAIKVEVTDIVPKGIMQMAFHYWEAHSNELTSNGLDAISFTPTYKAAVKMHKITPEEYLVTLNEKRNKFYSQKIIYEDRHHH